MRFCCRSGDIRRRFSLQWLMIPCRLPQARPLLRGTVEPVAPHAPLTLASAAAPPAGGVLRATQASAPDITSSIAPAAQDKQHQSSAPNGERRSAALGPDQIGALLRGKLDDGSRLVRAAQIALAKLGYAVKSDGVDDSTTRRALRHFERAHNSTPTTEISSELVKQRRQREVDAALFKLGERPPVPLM